MFVPVFINLNTPLTIKINYTCIRVNAYACIRVDLLDGTYTLTQEGDGTVDGELNQLGEQQDLDQSLEEPKSCVSVELEEGKHQLI
jgi:hypothetical protein